MEYINQFFRITRKELDELVTWKDGAPVDEFWEMFDLARADADAILSQNGRLHIENAELHATLKKYELHNIGLLRENMILKEQLDSNLQEQPHE